MSRLLAAVLAVSAAAAMVPARAAAPARRTTPPPPAVQVAGDSSAYQRAQADLSQARAALAQLDHQLASAQQQVGATDAAVAADAARSDALRSEIRAMARTSYQTEGSLLSSALDARSIGALWDTVAEARVVSERQRALLDQLEQLRRTDEAARAGAHALLGTVESQRAAAQAHLLQLQSEMSGLAATLQAAGQVVSGAAGRVPGQRLPQTTGDAGQCTWYAEQAWVTYSDPTSPVMTGDGADVVPNLAQAMGRSVDLEPQPGALVSWERPLLSAYGHVAYVAAVDRDPAGNLTGFTVWEMNYQGPFTTDVRHVTWTGPSPQVVFLNPPQAVDPLAAAAVTP